MAKNKKSKKRHGPQHQETSASAVSVAAEGPHDERFEGAASRDDSDLTAGSDGNGGRSDDVATSSGDRGGGERRPSSSTGGPGFFAVYKPGQGYYTRLGTAIGGGAIVVFGAHYLYGLLSSDNQAVKLGVPSILLAVLGVVLFWIAGSNRKTNDFFIATEGEMKKVSWSTKKEVIGSTKVVLAFTFMMALFLFIVDSAFIALFSVIDVLQMPILELIGWE
ncbi:MAG: preprotein translocase subunit SecE [Chloroflexi bacterium]|nr:preprotein translocase subunit SecE [Chloroflexota bacterium]